MRSLAVVAALLIGLAADTVAKAQNEPTPPTAEQIEAAVKADAAKPDPATVTAPPPADDAPPPMKPRHKGFVVEGSLGALAFYGQFRHVAPLAPWFHVQVGYELFRWLMLFGEGELAFSDTSEAQDPSKSRAFAVFGFGAGARATVHATDRVAFFAQASLGAMKADVPSGAFAVLGFRDAESLGASLAARLGVEWYAVDRHLALGLAVGLRDATGFSKATAAADTPLMGDFSAALRYTF